MSTPNAQILVSKYHFPINRIKTLLKKWLILARPETEKFQGEPEHLVPESKESSQRFIGSPQMDTGSGLKGSNLGQYGHQN